jgi:N-acetylglucosaminyl-diphospho-decaprenol L-rhamnosyltransferase
MRATRGAAEVREDGDGTKPSLSRGNARPCPPDAGRIASGQVPGVLFVSYSGTFGGAERVLLDCAAGLHDTVVLACPPGDLARRAGRARLPVLTLPERSLALRSSLATRVGAVAAFCDHAVRLRALVSSLEPDLVVAWGMRPAMAWRIGGGARPALIAHHDFLPGPLIAAAVRAAARRAQAVVVPSAAVAADLDPRRRLGSRMHVVHPGVDLERFATTREPVLPPEVVVLGALAEWKRPDLALEIIALARRRLPELRLRLVGDAVTPGAALPGRLRQQVEAANLGAAVELTGAHADPRDDLARASCLLHCAPREPFGLVVLEALASGRPAVVPDSAGPSEIIDPSCGRRYPPGDAAAAAAALVELLADPWVARRAGQAGREMVQRRFERSRTRAGFRAAVSDALARAEDRDRCRPRPQPATGTALTLVTVSHNSAAEMRTLLDSVARHLPGARTVVVDCASGDESVAVAEGRPDVDVVALAENVGFGRACNRGLELVRTPATALVNPDVELVDSSLLALVAESLRHDRRERLLAPRVLNGDGTIQDTVHPVPDGAADLVRSVVPAAAVPGRLGVALAPWRSPHPRRVGWAVGCALVARTETLRTLGPFDESLFMYGEDLELGLHARQAGIETWLWPVARVIHRGGHSSRREFGAEPFARLAAGRHAAIQTRLGRRRAALDDVTQALTFVCRGLLKRLLGLPGTRERRQLAAVAALLRPR